MKSKIIIEKNVENIISKIDCFVVCNYFQTQDRILNLGFVTEGFARIKTGKEVGMWRVKPKDK